MASTTTKIMTPVGTLDWPYLTKPDEKYGKYHTKIILEDTAETQEMLKVISAAHEAAYAEASKAAKDSKGGKRVKVADIPYFQNDAGKWILKAAMNMGGVNRTTKEGFVQAPRIFDAKNQPWDNSMSIYGGATARLCIELSPFSSPTVGAGVSLRLKDVQVLSLAARTVSSPFGSVGGEAPESAHNEGGFGGTPLGASGGDAAGSTNGDF